METVFGLDFSQSPQFLNIMYKLRFIFPLALLSAALFLLTTATGCEGCVEKKVPVTETEAEIQFDTIAHDFGLIPQGEKREYDFVFHNIGSKPLIIQQVNPTCGCISEHHSVRPVMPGRSGKVTAIYDDAHAHPGHFHKGLGIHSNGKTGFIMLTVDGEVVEK